MPNEFKRSRPWTKCKRFQGQFYGVSLDVYNMNWNCRLACRPCLPAAETGKCPRWLLAQPCGQNKPLHLVRDHTHVLFIILFAFSPDAWCFHLSGDMWSATCEGLFVPDASLFLNRGSDCTTWPFSKPLLPTSASGAAHERGWRHGELRSRPCWPRPVQCARPGGVWPAQASLHRGRAEASANDQEGPQNAGARWSEGTTDNFIFKNSFPNFLCCWQVYMNNQWKSNIINISKG